MLSYDSLIEQAKARGMPHTKSRGILREYLQILILKEVYKTTAGKKLYFTGGTYLRLAHNLKRFSEDLDFNTGKLSKKEFESILETVKTELKRTGMDSKLSFSHWDGIYAAKLVFPEVERGYNIISPYSRKEGIAIKVETNKPKWKIKKETRLISGFGEAYPAICTDIGALFADKVDAFLRKNKARHLYDLIFMLSHNYSVDKVVLKSLGIKEDPMDIMLSRIKSIPKTELKKQAESLRPFLFEESDAELIANARDILPPLLEKYKGQT